MRRNFRHEAVTIPHFASDPQLHSASEADGFVVVHGGKAPNATDLAQPVHYVESVFHSTAPTEQVRFNIVMSAKRLFG